MAVFDGEVGQEGDDGASGGPAFATNFSPHVHEQLKTVQTDLEANMIKIIAASEPFPLPGRPVRRLVASCLMAFYMRGETKSLFDTIQAFLKLLAETKPPAKDSSRT